MSEIKRLIKAINEQINGWELDVEEDNWVVMNVPVDLTVGEIFEMPDHGMLVISAIEMPQDDLASVYVRRRNTLEVMNESIEGAVDKEGREGDQDV